MRAEATLIYNPLAGGKDATPIMGDVAAFWRRLGWEIHVQPSTRAGHARELAQAAAKNGHRLVLAAGGDGTIGEVAAGLVHSETVMAPLPAGTGNSFAREFGLPRPNHDLPRRLMEASQALAGGLVQRIDVGSSGGSRYWMQWTSAGLDGFFIRHIEPRPRFWRKLGSLGFFLQTLPYVPRYPGMRAVVNVDGREVRGQYTMVTVSNCRWYGGGHFLLNPEAKLDDGLLDVWLFKGASGFNIYRHVMLVALGRHHKSSRVERMTGSEVSIVAEPIVAAHSDGDADGETPLLCRLEERALRVLVPESAPSGLFMLPGEALI
jgi:YegS/Rv2252/BmrU family lipid kinase